MISLIKVASVAALSWMLLVLSLWSVFVYSLQGEYGGLLSILMQSFCIIWTQYFLLLDGPFQSLSVFTYHSSLLMKFCTFFCIRNLKWVMNWETNIPLICWHKGGHCTIKHLVSFRTQNIFLVCLKAACKWPWTTKQVLKVNLFKIEIHTSSESCFSTIRQ